MSAPRIDVVTIFPDYLAPLDLSLIGKARTSGLVDVRVHDLRDVTTDRHRTVDDAPLGGGAGMVMRPDVWLRAIEATATGSLVPAEADPGNADQADQGDAERDPREVVVLVPTPSGRPLTQATAQRLADELSAPDVRAVVACGRYEGIDARLVPALADHPGVRRVEEFSLGDFVLNGGEVAALALLEAVVRLLPDVLGNPESVVEESFSQPLLEYPVYTRPADWEGREVPQVLLSGHHARIARWRRDLSLTRTAQRRPDLLDALESTPLDRHDLDVLREAGVVRGRDGSLVGPLRVRDATAQDADALADLAATTFPLACPDATTLGDVRRHVAQHLSPERWHAMLADADHHVLLLVDRSGRVLGYSMLLTGTAQGGSLVGTGQARDGVRYVELSKVYLLARCHGTGAAAPLMAATLARAEELGEAVWLGTNAGNAAARRSYERHGFAVVGERTFRVGEVDHSDVVMLRSVADLSAGSEPPDTAATGAVDREPEHRPNLAP